MTILFVNQRPSPSSPHPQPLPTQTEDTQSGEPGAAWKCLPAEVGRANSFSKSFIAVGKGGAYKCNTHAGPRALAAAAAKILRSCSVEPGCIKSNQRSQTACACARENR